MEVINNRFAIVYTRRNISLPKGKINIHGNSNLNQTEQDQEDNGQIIEWELEFNITRWPSLLCHRTTSPYLFSPNFTFQLDYNQVAGTIEILRTKT